MKPSYWQYENSERQVVWFRGRVKVYREATVENVPCKEVRKNKKQAIEDAKKLMKTLKTTA